MNFGELRSLLHGKPSPESFAVLIQALHAEPEARHDEVRAQWIPYADTLLTAWPDTAKVCPPGLVECFEQQEHVWTPLIRGVDYVGVSLGAARVDQIIDASHMRQVTHLKLGAVNMQWHDMIHLLERAPFEVLTSFAFYRSGRVDMSELEQLFSLPMFTRLERLSLERWTNMKAPVFDVLARAPWLEQLTSLDLTACPVSKKRLAALLATGKLEQLTHFRLHRLMGYEDVYKGCLAQIARANLPELRSLGGAVMTRQDGEALLSSPHLARLERLDLDVVWECDGFVRRLIDTHESFGALRELGIHAGQVDETPLEDVGIRDETLMALCDEGVWAELKALSLSSPHLSAQALRRFAGSGLMSRLESLELFLCGEHPDTLLQELCAHPGMAALEHLLVRDLNMPPRSSDGR